MDINSALHWFTFLLPLALMPTVFLVGFSMVSSLVYYAFDMIAENLIGAVS